MNLCLITCLFSSELRTRRYHGSLNDALSEISINITIPMPGLVLVSPTTSDSPCYKPFLFFSFSLVRLGNLHVVEGDRGPFLLSDVYDICARNRKLYSNGAQIYRIS